MKILKKLNLNKALLKGKSTRPQVARIPLDTSVGRPPPKAAGAAACGHADAARPRRDRGAVASRLGEEEEWGPEQGQLGDGSPEATPPPRRGGKQARGKCQACESARGRGRGRRRSLGRARGSGYKKNRRASLLPLPPYFLPWRAHPPPPASLLAFPLFSPLLFFFLFYPCLSSSQKPKIF